MSESDIERQKKSRFARLGVEGRQNAMNDATPDIQSPGMINEMDKELAANQKKERASARGKRPRQH
jgi:hypothetical protein